MMLAGGIVEPGGGQSGSVSAYVVLSAGGKSRLFKVRGVTSETEITELPGATTVDLGRFQSELASDLAPALEAIRAAGGPGAIAPPKKEWVCGLVREHLLGAEGLVVD